MGGTGLKFESRQGKNHTQSAPQRHFYCFLKEIWILRSGCSLKSPIRATERFVQLSCDSVSYFIDVFKHGSCRTTRNAYSLETTVTESPRSHFLMVSKSLNIQADALSPVCLSQSHFSTCPKLFFSFFWIQVNICISLSLPLFLSLCLIHSHTPSHTHTHTLTHTRARMHTHVQ